MTEKEHLCDEELKAVAGGGMYDDKKYKKVVAFCHDCITQYKHTSKDGRTINEWCDYLRTLPCTNCKRMGLGVLDYE